MYTIFAQSVVPETKVICYLYQKTIRAQEVEYFFRHSPGYEVALALFANQINILNVCTSLWRFPIEISLRAIFVERYSGQIF